MLVGYRYWDAHEEVPLFPLRHGLGYGDVSVSSVDTDMRTDGSVAVKVPLVNRGKRATRAVPQVYLDFSSGATSRRDSSRASPACRSSQARTIEIPLSRTAFRFWDEGSARWRVLAGKYPVYVGRSSRDIARQGSVAVAGE